MSTPIADHIDAATARCRAALGTLDEADWARPSLLPDWTIAHVIAHLALNAEGLAGALNGATAGTGTPMYPSQAARERDIIDLAAQSPATILERYDAAAATFAAALDRLPDDVRETAHFVRIPGTDPMPVAQIPLMRWREVEIHDADLGLDFTAADWEPAFCVALLDRVTADHAADGPFTVQPTDLDRSWDVGGPGGPVVSGAAAALGWWLAGRGTGDGLSTHDGPLPTIGSWGTTPKPDQD